VASARDFAASSTVRVSGEVMDVSSCEWVPLRPHLNRRVGALRPPGSSISEVVRTKIGYLSLGVIREIVLIATSCNVSCGA
jgi:hypothetical protein